MFRYFSKLRISFTALRQIKTPKWPVSIETKNSLNKNDVKVPWGPLTTYWILVDH